MLEDWLSSDPQLDDLIEALESDVLERSDIATKLREKKLWQLTRYN